MENTSHRRNPKLTIEEFRKYPGNENLTDEELEKQSNTLLELSLILYELYQKEQFLPEMKNPAKDLPEMEVD